MTFADYLAIPAVNWSSLKELSKSPAHYRHRQQNPRPDSPAMQMGRLVHCAVLEPDALPERYAVWNATRRGNAWTDFAEAAFTNGMEVVTSAEYEKALAIRDAVRSHPVAGELVTGGIAETTMQWTDEATGLALKCRIDYLRPDGFTDLKTTRDATPREFSRSCANFAYHGQMGFYHRGCPIPEVTMIAVESEPPHDVVVYLPDEDFMWAGDELVTELLAKLKECMDTDTWPGRYEGVQSLSLPGWVFDEIEGETA